jgi:hypothetical protein
MDRSAFAVILLVGAAVSGTAYAQLPTPQPVYPDLAPTELPKGLTILPWRLGISSDYDGRSGSSPAQPGQKPAGRPAGAASEPARDRESARP